jgi:hypothetical protein
MKIEDLIPGFYDEFDVPSCDRSVNDKMKKMKAKLSVADLECLSRIPDPNFFHPGSRDKKISGSASASKNLSILTPKNCF